MPHNIYHGRQASIPGSRQPGIVYGKKTGRKYNAPKSAPGRSSMAMSGQYQDTLPVQFGTIPSVQSQQGYTSPQANPALRLPAPIGGRPPVMDVSGVRPPAPRTRPGDPLGGTGVNTRPLSPQQQFLGNAYMGQPLGQSGVTFGSSESMTQESDRLDKEIQQAQTPQPQPAGSSNAPRDRVPAPSRPAFTPPSAGPAPGVSPAAAPARATVGFGPPIVSSPAPAPQVSLQPSGPVPATARKTDSNLPPGFADLESQRKAGTLPFQLDQQQRQSEYERRTAATPQRPGVDEGLQDRLRAKYGGPNFRSRSVASEGLGDGRDFDRMREADAAAEADFVMPTVAPLMNRDFRNVDPIVEDMVRTGDARRREQRGTPERGTAAADQLFRDQRQRRRDRSEANMPIRQYRALMQNQQEVAPVLFGGQGTPYVNVARRFNQGPGLNQRTLAAMRMVRGDRLQDEKIDRDRFVEDRAFGEGARQFDASNEVARMKADAAVKAAESQASYNQKKLDIEGRVADGTIANNEANVELKRAEAEYRQKIDDADRQERLVTSSAEQGNLNAQAELAGMAGVEPDNTEVQRQSAAYIQTIPATPQVPVGGIGEMEFEERATMANTVKFILSDDSVSNDVKIQTLRQMGIVDEDDMNLLQNNTRYDKFGTGEYLLTEGYRSLFEG